MTAARKSEGRGPRAEGGRKVRRDRNGLVRCRVCGCTNVDACMPSCGWTPGYTDLCTGCDDAAVALVKWCDGARRVNRSGLWREVYLRRGCV